MTSIFIILINNEKEVVWKLLIIISNDLPEHVSGNPVIDEWVHEVSWCGIE
ncbi:hypothetical protein [Citrobacter meridianamericanus]|uniref:Uncharacterized protein n=1 Tax=Citrobacter meridianamericanus TaxID=2894201 RepID=A0ABT1B8N0_9ENTR|nr:hypothetical protein [Citrobacter meridianamericanus]MCO5781369.1 hypothetical protein [Citrobacter meridianamericanus]